MAKQKENAKQGDQVIESISLKDPGQVIELRNGMRITADNLSVERYKQLIALSPKFAEYFNVKLTNKQNEQLEMGS